MKKLLSVLLCCVMLLGCLGLSGCGAEQGNVVNVYNWGEYIDESIFEDFEAETGITGQRFAADLDEHAFIFEFVQTNHSDSSAGLTRSLRRFA